MGDEVQLISDGEGLAVIGNATDVERFLASEGLSSKELGLPRLSAIAGGTAGALQASSAIVADSGRWVKLTKESAQAIKKYGLMKSKDTGLDMGVIYAKGDAAGIKGIVQFAKAGPGTLLNPANLAGAGALMQQVAMQQAMDEITDYLAVIDEKVDDILRAQKDAVLADMIGVDLVVEEAMTIRESVGRVSEVTWSKVQATSATIARTQAYALRQLDALAEKLERKSDLGGLIKATKEADAKVQEWLAVLARCFQLQDALAVLELDRVLDAEPDELDRHRVGIKTARQNRLDLISRRTQRLIARMDAAAGFANTKVLLSPIDSPALVRTSNHVASVVVEFQGRLGIESDRQEADAKRWLQAAADVRDKVLETGSGGVDAARQLGTETIDRARSVGGKALDSGSEGVARASEATSKLLSGIAERARRRRGDADEPEGNS